MLEVVFGNNAAGGLSLAMSRAETAPLEGSREEILSFYLLLCVGPIDEDGIGPAREEVLGSLYPEWEADIEKWTAKGRKNLSVLLERAEKGEPIRVWSSHDPAEACGAYWLMEQLRPLGFEKRNVTLVKLPEWEERPDGVIVRYTSWGAVPPERFGRMAERGEPLSANEMRMMANCWRQLRQENAPLRAVLNGRVVSAPESLYDWQILREIALQGEEFNEALVVGNVIGKYQLGIGDGWIARRIEHFIREGMLEPVTQAGRDEPSYRRILRKLCR